MNSIEKSAKTVKEAIKLGLEELRCDSADVDIEVVEIGSPGIFGMFGKPARVRLTRKDSGNDFRFDMPSMTLDTPAQPRKQGKEQQQRVQPQQQQPAKKREPRAEEPKAEPREARKGEAGTAKGRTAAQ